MKSQTLLPTLCASLACVAFQLDIPVLRAEVIADSVIGFSGNPPEGVLLMANPLDSDGDQLPDFWELIYADDLSLLTASGDNDNDGLDNTGEFERDANPLVSDTDSDGLSDLVETKTGIFVSLTDTGTDPRKADTDEDGRTDGDEINVAPTTNPHLADTDEDGYTDGSEIATGHDPTDPSNNPGTTRIAASREEFFGVQGMNDWHYGYRNLEADGGATDYDPINHFIPFAPADWQGTYWDLNTALSSPWTEMGRDIAHPSGASPLHWAVRRWVANELTEDTALALRWHAHKTNVNGGNGVTVAIHINGRQVDNAVIAFNDSVGVTHTYYVVAQPGDIIDQILSPTGTDGNNQDASDGTFLWLEVDTAIPPDATQPDGTPFTGHLPDLLDIDFNGGIGQVTLTWRSRSSRTYAVETTADFETWTPLVTGHPSAGVRTSYTETLSTPRPDLRFYRVRQE